MHESLRKIAVVGKDQHAFGIGVESADMMKSVESRREEIVNCLASELIATGADITAWLVKNYHHFFLWKHALAIKANVIRGSNSCGKLQTRRSVDFNAPCFDQLLAASTRANAARS
jgi:hypothetical protein